MLYKKLNPINNDDPCDENREQEDNKIGNAQDKYFKKIDLLKYNNSKDGIYISYKDKVYDVTNFVKNHPGGESKIMLAAGKSADPYWNLYPQHIKNALPILDSIEIGKLSDYIPEDEKNFKDLYIKKYFPKKCVL